MMRPDSHRSPVRVLLGASLALTACTADVSGPAASQLVPMCHGSGSAAFVLRVAPQAVQAHERHGDYRTELFVRPTDDAPTTDGAHFRRIGDALAVVRAGRLARGETVAAACRITIAVPAGVFAGTTRETSDTTLERFPLVVDVPDVTLRGALVMPLDPTGRAMAVPGDAPESLLSPTEPLPLVGGTTSQMASSTPLVVVNAHPDGPAGHGFVIEGFAFRSGHVGVDTLAGGRGVLAMRVRALVVRGNRFERGFTESIDLRVGDARVERNHLGGGASSGGAGACDICLAGPGDFAVVGNRLLAGGLPGILMVPATLLPVPAGVEQYTLPAAATLTATIANNEVRNHLRKPVGAGVRVAAVGIGAPNVVGTSRVSVRDNWLADNTFGVIVEAGFPIAGSALRGDVEVSLGGNVIERSCQAPLLVSLSRHTSGLGLTTQPYLRGSGFSIMLHGDVRWDDAWFSHPDGFENSLVVDGQPVANGVRAAYDGSRVCTASEP